MQIADCYKLMFIESINLFVMPCSTLFIDHIHRLYNKIIVLLHNSPMDKICTHIKYRLDKGGMALYFYYMPKSSSFFRVGPPHNTQN